MDSVKTFEDIMRRDCVRMSEMTDNIHIAFEFGGSDHIKIHFLDIFDSESAACSDTARRKEDKSKIVAQFESQIPVGKIQCVDGVL